MGFTVFAFSFVFLVSCLFSLVKVTTSDENNLIKFPLLMPDVQPLKKDTYFCTAFKMPRQEHQYIVEFTPNATSAAAHHVLIYGCEEPGYYERDTPRAIWDCGEMAISHGQYVTAPNCKSGSQIIYAWAMDAPKLALPDSVGFKVGGSTGINYLVLQVHYANVDRFLNGATDNSGIVLSLLPGISPRVTKRAGVLLLGTGGKIPANTEEHMETTCLIDEPIKIHPFAFRTHTHKLGRVVSGWRVDKNGWDLIGKHDPQQPQMFYPVENKDLVVNEGDILAARCTMNNIRDHTVRIGATGNDEMCNFYIMYFVDGDRILDKKYCFSFGPPFYRWSYDKELGSVPKEVDLQASTL